MGREPRTARRGVAINGGQRRREARCWPVRLLALSVVRVGRTVLGCAPEATSYAPPLIGWPFRSRLGGALVEIARPRVLRMRCPLRLAASSRGSGLSRDAAIRVGVVLSRSERAASGSASSWSGLQRSPYSCRSRSGRRPAVAARCAGTSRRIGAGRGASRITAATSRAGAVTETVSLVTWAAK
jgi:hypothetical protein